jgi:uncharacterized membrane protein YeaQ/YmgE (transglycosylase-associated protein family)
MAEESNTRWWAIILGGLLAFLASLAITAATVAGYAFVLAVRAQGAPDPNKISAFANHYIPYLAPIVLSLLVLIAARWVVRRDHSQRTLPGVLVGVVAGLLTLVFVRRPGWQDLIGLLLPPVAGWLGALWARSRSPVIR